MLNKVVRGLDPSYIDVQHQPFHLIETMIQRLNENFDYSNTINSAWLQRRIGAALSSYRHDLMKIIEAGGDPPHWISEKIWRKLVIMADSDAFKAKSQQMKLANACRPTLGRTGPIGVAGITERLRMQLGKTLDSDEVEDEVNRNKGYSGKSRERKLKSLREHVSTSNIRVSRETRRRSVTPNSTRSEDASARSSEIPRTGNQLSEEEQPLRDPSDHANDDPDIEFARTHPLGRVILRQMEELKQTTECSQTELSMLLDGLRSQITVLRSSSGSCNVQPQQSGIPNEEVPIQANPVHSLNSRSNSGRCYVKLSSECSISLNIVKYITF